MKIGQRVARAGLLAGVVITAAGSAAAFAVPAAAQTVLSATPKPTPQKPAGKKAVAPLNASCGKAGSNKDSATGHTTTNGVNIRTGSGTSCTSVGQAQTSHTLDYYCYTAGNDGFSWTYLKDLSTGKVGWIRDDLLSNTGSWSYCGF